MFINNKKRSTNKKSTISPTEQGMKIFFYPADAIGHINACIGLAQELFKRKHQIFFISNNSFKGQYEVFGFNEILLENNAHSVESAIADPKEDIIKLISQQLLQNGIFSNCKPTEKLKRMNQRNMLNILYKGTLLANKQIEKAIEIEKPDAIVIDSVFIPPCVICKDIPWICLFSGNPILMYQSDQLPPAFIGLPTNDKSSWQEGRRILQEHFLDPIEKRQLEMLNKFCCPSSKIHKVKFYNSSYLNIYGYPQELDYDDIVQRNDKLIRCDAFCRFEPELFELPLEFRKKLKQGDKLIYISMGSMGSIDVQLMKRIVTPLGQLKHKFIVSKGPLQDQYELPGNMWGQAYLPQIKILPLVDLVITHGGNNTVTEAFSFGKPMIVLPLLTDQFDNAQRIAEKGFGIRINPYDFEDCQLLEAIDRLLNDDSLKIKLEKSLKRIAASNCKQKACVAIEEMIDQQHNKGVLGTK